MALSHGQLPIHQQSTNTVLVEFLTFFNGITATTNPTLILLPCDKNELFQFPNYILIQVFKFASDLSCH